MVMEDDKQALPAVTTETVSKEDKEDRIITEFIVITERTAPWNGNLEDWDWLFEVEAKRLKNKYPESTIQICVLDYSDKPEDLSLFPKRVSLHRLSENFEFSLTECFLKWSLKHSNYELFHDLVATDEKDIIDCNIRDAFQKGWLAYLHQPERELKEEVARIL